MRKEQDQKSSLKPRKFSSGEQTKALSDCQHSSSSWQSYSTKQLSVQAAARDLLEHAGPSTAGVSCRMTSGVLAAAHGHAHLVARHH